MYKDKEKKTKNKNEELENDKYIILDLNKEENLDKYLEYFNSDYFLEIMKIFNLYSNNKITIQQTLLEKLPVLI